MINLPYVSIVMPVFNAGIFISFSIDSVLNQEFKEWELLVVDGGSTDNTTEVVSRYSAMDHRVRLVPNPDDKGPAHARATGVKLARGVYVAFLDGDDLWLRKKLLLQLNFMHRTGTDFSYTQYRVINSQGTEASCALSIHRQYNYLSYFFLRGICCSSVVVKRNLLTKDILDSNNTWVAEDTVVWLKLLRDGVRARGVTEPLVLYRDAVGSLSKNRFKNQVSVWRIYRDDFNHSLIFACLAYISYVINVAFRRFSSCMCTILRGKKKVNCLLR